MTKHHDTVQVIFSDITTQVVVGKDNPSFSFTNGWFGDISALQPDDSGRTQWEGFIQQLLVGASLQLVGSPIGSSEHLIAAGFIAPHPVLAGDIGKIDRLNAEQVTSVTKRLRSVIFTHPNLSRATPQENPTIVGVVDYCGAGDEVYRFILTGDLAVRAWNKVLILSQELKNSTPVWLNFPRFKTRVIPREPFPVMAEAA